MTDYNVTKITQSTECDAYKYDIAKKKETKLSSLSQEGIAGDVARAVEEELRRRAHPLQRLEHR